ncbi:uncharacterized protein LOC134242583 [Saccostrea cucullata]|uniref:uncharacterized protein LOC134242583 n=1 Tax=Saccostrea cuccullata TaxID=36930 RepID=UPI002ED40DF4
MLSVIATTSFIAAVVVFVDLYENTWLYESVGHILIPVFRSATKLIASIFWIISWILVRTHLRSNISIASTSSSRFVISLVLVLLWIFGLGATFSSILSAIANIQCALQNSGTSVRQTYIVNGVCRIGQPLFVLIQTIVLSRISRFHLTFNRTVHWFLIFILLTNTGAWVYNISLLNRKISFSQNSSTFTFCYWKTDIATKAIIPLHPILVPLEQEYNFLSICVILTITLHSHWTYKLRSTKNIHAILVSSSSIVHEGRKQYKGITKREILYMIVSIFCFLPAIVVTILRRISNSEMLTNDWQLTVIFPNVIIIACIFRGFHIVQRLKKTLLSCDILLDNFLDNDAIYIVCASGNFIYYALAVAFAYYGIEIWTVVLKYVLGLVEVYYQTIFILYLKRFKSQCYLRLPFVIIMLLISNMVMWVYFQFWIFYVSYSNTDEVWGTLHPAARQVLYTFICFYRFQSFISLYRIYKSD